MSFLTSKCFLVSCTCLLCLAMAIQLVLMANSWTFYYLVYRLIISFFGYRAKFQFGVYVDVGDAGVQHNLCINNANHSVSCELVGLELLLQTIIPKDFAAVYRNSPSKLIPAMRNPFAEPFSYTLPFGTQRKDAQIMNLSTVLMYRHKYDADDNIINIYENGIIVYFHGGGYITGTCKVQHKFMSYLSLVTGLPVLGIDYKLAPEYPMQSGAILTDAENILTRYLHQDLAIEYQNMFIIGDSAGGGVCLIIQHFLKSQFDIDIGGSVLISPSIDATYNPSLSKSLIDNEEYDVLLSLAALELFLQWRFGCRDIHGVFIQNATFDTIDECVQSGIDVINGTHFSPASYDWNVFNRTQNGMKNQENEKDHDNGSGNRIGANAKTNMFFIASEYEVLRDESVRAHALALAHNVNSQLRIIPGTGLHVLPIFMDIPEAVEVVNEISFVIRDWRRTQ